VQAHLGKGQRVYVEGRLSTRSWDGPDGQKRFMTEVIANQVLFLDRPQASSLPDSGGGAGDIDPDDIPFEN
jgi:single-strand DNA-binding protein